MNLQKRIFRLNVVMLVISLLVMIGVSIYVGNNIYIHENATSSSKNLVTIQSKISDFEGDDFSSLADDLSEAGAKLYVTSDNREVYSNLTEDEDDIEDYTRGSVTASTDVSYVEDAVVIRREVSVSGETYELYAILDDDEEAAERNEFQTFLVQMLVIGGTAVILIVALNAVFTRRTLSYILKPLNELQAGVQRIQLGDYQTDIDYQGDQEFEQLTDGFNQMQHSLLETMEENRRYEQNRTQMVADISHDLRTPLTSIKGYTKGILDGVANTDDKRQQYLSVIYQKSVLMEDLLEKLFVFSQLETDKLPFSYQEIDLSTFFQDYVVEKELELAGQEIDFQLTIEKSLPVRVDAVQLTRVLDNLIDNAKKYVTARPLKLELIAKHQGDQVMWTFKDNGPGVQEENLANLFDEFYREDQARQIDGHGLGLAIIKSIVTEMGGTVEAANQDGLTFTFTLPMSRKERHG